MNKKIFLRSLTVSFIIVFNIMLLVLGICKAYENIRLIGYGEYVSAVEIGSGYIRVLDYKIDF